MRRDALETLMNDIEAADPLDFSDLSIGEDAARSMMASHFCELDARLERAGLAAEERLTVMAAIAAHTMEANFLVHLQRLRGQAGGFDLREWMTRHGFG